MIESPAADARPLTQPLQPAAQNDPWVVACAGSNVYLSRAESSIADKVDELDRSDPEAGPPFPQNSQSLKLVTSRDAARVFGVGGLKAVWCDGGWFWVGRGWWDGCSLVVTSDSGV